MATTPEEEEVDDYWEDREATKKIAGSYANRVFVQPMGDGTLRVNFGEILDGEPVYHTAIVMTAAHVWYAGDLLTRMATAVLSPPPPPGPTPPDVTAVEGDHGQG